MAEHSPTTVAQSPLWAVLAGLCASLVGIGLARFAYTPLIPVLVAAGWFSPGAAAYLGAANLAGYLGGALFGRRLLALYSAPVVLRGLMLLASAAFFGCAFPFSFGWYFLWRFAAGLAGGGLMVLAAPTVLPHVPFQRRGLAGGAIFTGVGIGIAASGTLVPLLLRLGLPATWHGLGLLSLALTGLAWGGWPRGERPAGSASPGAEPPVPMRSGWVLRAVYVEYGLNAAGLVPHMVFLVDFVARGLGQGLAAGATQWVLFGVGAMAGPLLAGWLADRIGFGAALRVALAMQAGAVVLPALSTAAVPLGVSSLLTGAFVPGVVPLVLGRVQQLLPGDLPGQRAAWSYATIAFALGQAVAAYGLAYLLAQGQPHHLLFVLAGGVLATALALDLLARATAARR